MSSNLQIYNNELPSLIPDFLECPSCRFEYNEQFRVPVIVSCGHTYCRNCVNNRFHYKNKRCHYGCKIENQKIVINYHLISYMKKYNEIKSDIPLFSKELFRKQYNKIILLFVIIMLLIISCIFSLSFIMLRRTDGQQTTIQNNIQSFEIHNLKNTIQMQKPNINIKQYSKIAQANKIQQSNEIVREQRHMNK